MFARTIRDRLAILAAVAGFSLAAVEAFSQAGDVFEGIWGCTVPSPPQCGSDITFECGSGNTCCYVVWYTSSGCIFDWNPACCVNPENGCHGRIRDGVIYNWCGGPNDDPYEDPKTDPGIIDF